MNDILERAAWTAVEAVAGVLIVAVADLPGLYIPIIATALSALKTYAKSRLASA